MKNLIIFGTGGLAKELIGYIEGETESHGECYNILGCVSTQPFNNADFDFLVWPEYPSGILAGIDAWAMMGVSDPALKRKFYDAAGFGVKWETYIHPSAVISPYARIGEGCVICPGAVVAGDSKLGRFVFMNTNATTAHDTRIGDFVCMMPNSEVCGDCVIGRDAFIGIGAQILPGVTMGVGARASAGAIVRKSVAPGVTVYGDPARERVIPDHMVSE